MVHKALKIYYKNVMSDVVGSVHGITSDQLKELADKTSPLIQQMNEQRKAGQIPYRNLPFDSENLEHVKELAAEFKANCENLVVLGIGGSALGNIALQSALNPFMYNLDDKNRLSPRLFVLDNIDPPQFASFLNWIEDRLEATVFNVISKSGRTAETASQFLTIRKMLLDKLGPKALKKHLVATTDSEKGTLRNIAEQDRLRCLEVPSGVGGRFSVLSHVGLFSAYMCGIDVDALLAGARDMDSRVIGKDFYSNPAATLAAVNYHFYNHGKRMSVMMPYSHALKDLADWYRQLWAESLGKEKDLKGTKVNIGPTPVKALGTTDQHSQVQLYREGPNDKLFTFLQVNNFEQDPDIGPAPKSAPELSYLSGKNMSSLFNSEKKATEYALLLGSRPCLNIIFERVEPYSVGQFIYLYQVTTSLIAGLFGINAYDQPAVELGKEATFALMQRQGYEALADKVRPYSIVDDGFVV